MIRAAGRELITKLTKEALDAQVGATVANEAKLLDEFGKVISVKDVQVADAGKVLSDSHTVLASSPLGEG